MSLIKKLIFTILCLQYSFLQAQEVIFPDWGVFSNKEWDINKYEKDSTANAVILSEVAHSFVEDVKDYMIVTHIHRRIKILNKEGFSNGIIEIRHQNDEKIEKLIAKTYTNFEGNISSNELDSTNIYYEKNDEYFSSVKFSFPNIQVGSILEYSYDKKSPYFHSFSGGWVFQNELPTIYSHFYAHLPAFWTYRISTVNLDEKNIIQNKTIEKCLNIMGAVADCMFIEVKVNDIPASIDEPFSTSQYNYLKRIRFDLKSEREFIFGERFKYTVTWDDVDKNLFMRYDIGKNYGNKGFLKEEIPEEIKQTKDLLLRSQKIYKFIQNHLHWNGKKEIFKDFNLKKAYENQVGNIAEINTILVNALLAVDIKADLALLSTRKNGFVNKLYPVLFDFNYLVVHIHINGVDYFLDASSDLTPFGYLPFECLNDEIRVFPKNNKSYWFKYIPNYNNKVQITSNFTVNENGEINGKSRFIYEGFKAIEKRNEIMNIGKELYQNNIFNDDSEFEVTEHKFKDFEIIENPLEEIYYTNHLSLINHSNKFFFNPFLFNVIQINPFFQKLRQHPIDFGYPFQISYNISIKLPDEIQSVELPKNRYIKLNENAGELIYLIDNNNNLLNISLDFKILNTNFEADEYEYLKSFFAELIKIQNERIILTKTN